MDRRGKMEIKLIPPSDNDTRLNKANHVVNYEVLIRIRPTIVRSISFRVLVHDVTAFFFSAVLMFMFMCMWVWVVNGLTYSSCKMFLLVSPPLFLSSTFFSSSHFRVLCDDVKSLLDDDHVHAFFGFCYLVFFRHSLEYEERSHSVTCLCS